MNKFNIGFKNANQTFRALVKLQLKQNLKKSKLIKLKPYFLFSNIFDRYPFSSSINSLDTIFLMGKKNNVIDENLYNLVNWSDFMELWISKCNTNRRCYRSNFIVIFEYWIKKVFKKEIITPGIRFNSKSNDQKRVVTPRQAYKNGSDWLVMGRPITKGNIKKNIQNLIDHLSK